MSKVFGQVPGSLGTSYEHGNISNSSNLFASQGFGPFGNNGTDAFGAASSSFGAFGVFGSGSNLRDPFASNAIGTTNFPNLSTQGSAFGCNATNGFGAASSSFGTSSLVGNGSNLSNAFAPNAVGTARLPTQGSFLGACATNVFGTASSSLGTSSLFGNGSYLSNASAPITNGTTSLPTQGSVFGGSTTNVFGPFGASSSLLGMSREFGKSESSTNSFPLPTQGSVFGGSTTNVLGAPSSSLGMSREFGNAENSTNSFPLSNQGSVFGSPATSVFGTSSSSSNSSSPSFTFGKGSAPSNSNLDPFVSSTYGNASNASLAPFTPNTSMSTTSSTSPIFISQGFFGGSSTGVLGSLSASSPSLTFGQPAAFFGSSSTYTTTSIGGFGSFGSTTSRGPFGVESDENIPSFPIQKSPFGGTSTGSFGASLSSFLTSPTTFGSWSNFGQTSYGTMPVNPFSASSSAASPSLPGMPFYDGKSHEELRWEDYEPKSEVQRNSVSNQAQGINKQNLSLSLPSVTSSSGILSPSCAPAFSTKMNIPTFQTPCSSSPVPSSNISAFHTRTAMLTGSKCDQVTPSTSNNQRLLNPQLPTQPSRLWPDHLLGTTPNSLSIHSQSTGNGCDQVVSSSAIQPTKPWPNNGNAVTHTFQAPSPWTTENNGGVSLNVGSPQPDPPQQFTATTKAMESIIAVKDPFGSETATSRPLIGHSACSSFMQHGISSMPVFTKPEKTRVSSYFTPRHHSLKPLTLKVRKYNPSSDGTKVPFFDQAKEDQDISKGYNYIIPRENPRSVIAAPTKPTYVSASKKEASSLNHEVTVEYEDGTDNAKKTQISSSAPISCKDDFTKANDSTKVFKELLIPKLQRSDYYTEPKIETLASLESSFPGFCSHVKDFVVGRDGYGWVKFYGETDVRGLNLDSLVHFNTREVIVYDDESEKPPVGQGLNKAAEVTLLNVKCINKAGKQYTSGKMVEKYIEKLKLAAEKQGAEFVSYDPVKEEWKFSVQHF